MSTSPANVEPAPADSVGPLQTALLRVLKTLVFRHGPETPLDALPLAQLRALHVIGEHEDHKMQEIAHLLEIKLPAMSQIVDRLVKRGMVARRADPQDRRVVRIGLTEQARALIDAGRQAWQARIDASERNLDPRAVSQIVRSLELLAEAAERAENRPAPMPADSSSDADPLVQLIAGRPRYRRSRKVSPPLNEGSQ